MAFRIIITNCIEAKAVSILSMTEASLSCLFNTSTC
jgi:hypothetical protein